ncbi:MAG: hypothetical protein HN535_06070 [Flavobacteriales bacterium]|nr:hypothetical protein [Flavobacteriales bacterium]
MRNLLIICAIAICFTACKKLSGEGGTSLIEGKAYKIHTSDDYDYELDSLGNIAVDSLGNPITYKVIDTLYFQLDAGKDVFIIYSNDNTELYDDKFETDYNGKYHFEYLRKGEYTIYTYADSTDNSNVKYEYPVFKKMTISSNNSTNTVSDFIIEKNQ